MESCGFNVLDLCNKLLSASRMSNMPVSCVVTRWPEFRRCQKPKATRQTQTQTQTRSDGSSCLAEASRISPAACLPVSVISLSGWSPWGQRRCEGGLPRYHFVCHSPFCRPDCRPDIPKSRHRPPNLAPFSSLSRTRLAGALFLRHHSRPLPSQSLEGEA
ncbi:hypothetical protein BCV70DRAFT_117084 [Testicularia cyperi]|uniref:Uncharacterized protein n=1 Tax=Testicularia cyperi TaxID=1882483 RepID=A0A317XN90_9BASI|nr:hypothetical protein BCV70DRAFT_117084 [Testicularia cyperi]